MLGQAIARLHPLPRQWLYRIWGVPDINTRQKWFALWPHLCIMSDSLRLLDAGCGNGSWALELAARKSSWQITGLDKNPEAIGQANFAKERLGLTNVSFVCDDFLMYQPDEAYDVVLSVASAHYLVDEGKGAELFRAFHSWLQSGGKLLLLGPRCCDDVPAVSWLPAPMSKRRDVFSEQQLRSLCQDTGLSIEELQPAVFTMATIAKQLSLLHRSVRALVPLFYPLEWGLTVADRHLWFGPRESVYWVLSARRSF